MISYDDALVLHRQGKLAEAEAAYRDILKADPHAFRVLHMLGVLAAQQGRGIEAERMMAAAVTANPDYVEGHCDRGGALMALRRLAEALASFDAALARDPGFLPALANKGSVLLEMERGAEALDYFDRALAARPDLAVLWNNRGNALAKLGRPDAALASFDRALAMQPSLASAADGRAKCLRKLGRDEEALAVFQDLVRAAPDYPEALGNMLGTQLRLGDWTGTDAAAARIVDGVRAGRMAQSPRSFLLHAVNPADQLACAATYAAGRFPALRPRSGRTYDHSRLRVAYVSSDLRDHIVGQVIAGVLESHNREKIEVIGVSHGPDDGSAMRRRLEKACDRFVDVRGMGDAAVAAAMHDLEIDVAVDLNGYTDGERTRIFAHRPAPVQAGYLGYPGTLGAPVLDYIIADRWTIPPEHEPFYAERVARLPGSFFPAVAETAQETPARRDCGLPEYGFVFACFNRVDKIGPEAFGIWMRLLRATPGAVLWLRGDTAAVAHNLGRAAEAAGVDPARLVFAARAPLAAHIARHGCADLFLDTWPYNAHGTAAQALGAGLPLLTFATGGFAGRVSESLLRAAGLPDLVTSSVADYEAAALRLAADPGEVGRLREKLAAARAASPLFDAGVLARNLERAYETMTGRMRAGAGPESFTVESFTGDAATEGPERGPSVGGGG